MQFTRWSWCSILVASLLSTVAFAQSSAPAFMPRALIAGPDDSAVGRTVVLEGSLGSGSGKILSYRWYVRGRAQPISDAVQAVYTPERTGPLVFRLQMALQTADGQRTVLETMHTVNVYTRKIVLVADGSISDAKINAHRRTASGSDVFLRILHAPSVGTPVGDEEQLRAMLADESEAIGGANAIVLWTNGITGLQALQSTYAGREDRLAELQHQSIVIVSEGSLQTIARTVRGPYSVLKPQQILLTRKEAIDVLLRSPSVEDFVQELATRDLEHLRIDASSAGFRPWNALSWLVSLMLAKGIPSQTVLLLLVLPIIATILTFLKQVIGVTTFGLYTPSIITLSFLALGWKVGIVYLLFLLLISTAARRALLRFRLLYIPKVALILTVVSLALLLLMGVSALMGFVFSRETIFILLVMSTLSESFLTLKAEEGSRAAWLGILETVLASLLCVFIVQWGVFQSFILAYPEMLIFTLVINAFLGRWTGLRLVEYFRFRDVFKHLQHEE